MLHAFPGTTSPSLCLNSTMEALKAEMERKRKAVEKTGLVTAEKKYFKRGDLAKKNAEDYIARMRQIKGKSSGSSSGADGNAGGKAKGKDAVDEEEDEETRKRRLVSSSLLDDVLGDDFEKHMPSRSEVSIDSSFFSFYLCVVCAIYSVRFLLISVFAFISSFFPSFIPSVFDFISFFPSVMPSTSPSFSLLSFRS